MKHDDFEDVLKIDTSFLVLRVSCLLQEFKFPSKGLGYLMGHRWGTTMVLTNKKKVKLSP
jgi:spermidine/putrescine-binding protein